MGPPESEALGGQKRREMRDPQASRRLGEGLEDAGGERTAWDTGCITDCCYPGVVKVTARWLCPCAELVSTSLSISSNCQDSPVKWDTVTLRLQTRKLGLKEYTECPEGK